MNTKKIKKYFKILFVPISMLICLSIFLINSFASSGFDIEDNGKIESYNLADIYNLNVVESSQAYSYTNDNQILTLTNTNSSNSDPYIYFNNFITLAPNTTYSMYFISNNNIEYCGLSGYPYATSIAYSMYTYKTTFTTNSTQLVYGFGFEGLQGLDYEIKIMIYEGSGDLDYFPYGDYYTTPQQNDFIKYLIGNNYFSGGRASITQTSNNTYWDRQISNSNLYSGYTIGNTRIGNYVVGDTIYIENLTYDLVEGLKATNRYNFNYFTYIHLKPSLNFATSSVEYLSIQCKYVNLTIYAPNSSYTVSAYVGNSSDLPLSTNNDRIYFEQLGDYINISFDENDTRYLWDIEIVLNRSDSNFISPQTIISNTDSTISWDMYNIGFDDGVNSMQMKYNILESDYNKLVNENNSLRNSINTLSNEVDNLQNALNNNFGFRNVFFALADTPFKTASNMLGFELFGVNLFNALIGFITVLACIWLLKKFL